jgi:hypothetical protein
MLVKQYVNLYLLAHSPCVATVLHEHSFLCISLSYSDILERVQFVFGFQLSKQFVQQYDTDMHVNQIVKLPPLCLHVSNPCKLLEIEFRARKPIF